MYTAMQYDPKKIYKTIKRIKNPTIKQLIIETIKASQHTPSGYSGKDTRLKDLYDKVAYEDNPYADNPIERLRQEQIMRSIRAANSNVVQKGSSMKIPKKKQKKTCF